MAEIRAVNSREEVRNSRKMLASVLTTSWAMPKGMPMKLKHGEGCRNINNDELILRVVEKAKPATVTEFEMSLRSVLLTLGCNECGVDKTTSAGVLFRHSQSSEYRPPTQESVSSGTERTPYASQVSSWGNSTILDRLPSWERALYKGYKDDKSSDEDYVLKSVEDVAMTMDGNRNMEGSGFGDSKYGVKEVPATKLWIANKKRQITEDLIENTPVEGTPVPLPSTMPYRGSSIKDALLEAIEEIYSGRIVRAIEAIEEDEEEFTVESTLLDHDTILRLERMMSEVMQEKEEMRDRLEILVSDIKEGKIPCRNCTVDKKGKAPVRNTNVMPVMPIPMGPKRQNPVVRNTLPTETVKESSEVPEYKKEQGGFAGRSWSTVTRKGNQSGANIRVGKAEKKTVTKKAIVKKEVVGTEKERHLKIRFVGKRGMVHESPLGVMAEVVRVKLNTTLKDLNVDAYFAKARRNNLGDIEITLARTKADDLIVAGKAIEDAVKELGIKDFSFVLDTKKVKVYLAMSLLVRSGRRDWEVEDWQGEEAFDMLAADIEKSNPGVYVAARLSWVGKLGIMSKRKQRAAGLVVLCEETPELKNILGRNEPKMLIGGANRFCRTWRERSDTVICDRCLSVGHTLLECKASRKCRWCSKAHLSTEHKCPIVDFPAPKGMACKHCRRRCNLCETEEHYTGYRECTVLRNRRSTSPKYGKATPVEADNMLAQGVNDRSRNRFRQTEATVRKAPVDEQVRNNEVVGDRTTRPTMVIAKRSSSVPAESSRAAAGVECILSPW